MVTLNDGFDSDSGHRVVENLAETLSVVVVEGRAARTAIGEHGVGLEGLQNGILKLLTINRTADDLAQVLGNADATLVVGFENTFNFSLEPGIFVADIVITDDAGILAEAIQQIGHC